MENKSKIRIVSAISLIAAYYAGYYLGSENASFAFVTVLSYPILMIPGMLIMWIVGYLYEKKDDTLVPQSTPALVNKDPQNTEPRGGISNVGKEEPEKEK